MGGQVPSARSITYGVGWEVPRPPSTSQGLGHRVSLSCLAPGVRVQAAVRTLQAKRVPGTRNPPKNSLHPSLMPVPVNSPEQRPQEPGTGADTPILGLWPVAEKG